MANNLINSLFAPLVPTFLPAFPNDSNPIIYFSYSPLNDISLIQKIHVSVVNQLTNENALDNVNGVLVYNAADVNDDSLYNIGYNATTGMYYLTIPRKALKGPKKTEEDGTEIYPNWNTNQYYKVQLRLDCTKDSSTDFNDSIQLTTYLQDNLENFSEWSTVCLLRPIIQPYVELRGFENEDGITPAFNKGILPVNGQVYFGDIFNTSETETLQSYTLEIYDRNNVDIPVMKTGNIYTGNNLNPNDINYKLDLQAIDTTLNHQFILRIIITTRNQYSISRDYKFDIADFVEMTDFHPVGVNEDIDDLEIKVAVNKEEGTATFRFANNASIFGILYIKRSSSASNFINWETIYEGRVNDMVDMTIIDNTIGSHIWYQYSIQLENTAGALSAVYYTDMFFPEFYDAFITRKDTQLPIRYDFKVSSMKPIVNRAKIDTLGGRYPKFAENAVLNYKQFSIGGTISSEADFHQKFLNKRKYFGSNYNNYRVYLSQDKIEETVRNDAADWIDDAGNLLTTTRYDYLWEREFREEAIKWLNDGEPKLFRSATEGLIPVMITDINLTPKIQLNRIIYDFTATMYEVADGNSIESLESLGIIDVPRVTTSIGGGLASGDNENQDSSLDNYRLVTTVGQVYDFYPTDTFNIIASSESYSGKIYNSVLKKYSYGGVYANKDIVSGSIYIKNVQIYFHSEPHAFLIGDRNEIKYISEPSASDIASGKLQIGYTFQLKTRNAEQTQNIFVNERGYYQIPNNVDVLELAFNQVSDPSTGYVGDRVTVNYVVVYKEISKRGTIVSSQSINRTLVGQYMDVFKPEQYLGDKIRRRYGYKTNDFTQLMQSWKGISLDVTPYAVVNILYTKDKKYTTYVVGHTGILHLLPYFEIKELYFSGISMVKQPIERQNYLAEYEYVKTNISAQTIEEIENPIHNGVYTIENQLMIYYHDAWFNFKENDDGTGIAAVNVEGAINFLGDVIQTTYA